MAKISPSILSANFADLGHDVALVHEALVHLGNGGKLLVVLTRPRDYVKAPMPASVGAPWRTSSSSDITAPSLL